MAQENGAKGIGKKQKRFHLRVIINQDRQTEPEVGMRRKMSEKKINVLRVSEALGCICRENKGGGGA